MKILIVEDEVKTGDYLRQGLTEAGFVVDLARDGLDGLHLALSGDYDLIVLDVMLPSLDGWGILQTLRRSGRENPVLFLTARDQIEDRVRGLELGADDYLVKPFAFEELLVRVRALSRRFSIPNGERSELRSDDIVLDLRGHTARRGMRNLDLTPTEWNLLEYLMRNPGQTLSRQQILDYVWSYEQDVQTQMVDVYVSYLRRKLNAPGDSDPISTVRGIGYRLEKSNV